MIPLTAHRPAVNRRGPVLTLDRQSERCGRAGASRNAQIRHGLKELPTFAINTVSQDCNARNARRAVWLLATAALTIAALTLGGRITRQLDLGIGGRIEP